MLSNTLNRMRYIFHFKDASKSFFSFVVDVSVDQFLLCKMHLSACLVDTESYHLRRKFSPPSSTISLHT